MHQVQTRMVMPKRALVEHRPWLLLSIASAVAFYLLADDQMGETWKILLKGGACMALAVYAWQRHESFDAKLITLYLVLCSLADMALELWFEIGGALFFTAHLAAISLYLQHKRSALAPSQGLLVTGLLLLTPLICWILSGDILIGIYGLALGGMAAGAWASRFPRYRVGAGAILFVISDFLIFARMGGNLADLADWLVWPIYYSGQFLIATGVIRTLRGELKASAS